MERVNADVIRAIHEVAILDTPASRRGLYQALLASQLLLPVRNEADRLSEEPVRALVMSLSDGVALPAFTDWDAVALWPDRTTPATFMTVLGQGVFLLARGIKVDRVLINPSGPIGIPIASREIQILGDGGIPGEPGPDFTRIEAKKGALTCLGPPRTPVSPKLVAKLQVALAGESHVKRAFLFEGASGGTSRVCVGVEFGRRPFGGHPSKAEIEAVMGLIGRVLRGQLGDQVLDGIVLNGPILNSVEAQVPAFFSQTRK